MRKVTACGLGIAFALWGFSGALAQPQSEAPSPCASITDDKSRLQCYDAEHALKKSQPGARPSAAAPAPQPATTPAAVPAPAPAAVPAPAPKAAPDPAKPAATSGSADTGFGSETLPKKAKQAGGAEEASEITAMVSSVAGKRKGEYRITLDNGQVWAETQRTGGDPPEVGETVILRRGAMGSYFLSRGKGLALRVRRVK